MLTMIRFHKNIIMLSCSCLALSVLPLSGCTGFGLVTGVAAVTGISAAQEGGLNSAVRDAVIKVKINESWFQYNVDAFRKLSTTIEQGRVLITGVVQDPKHRVEAVRLAWQVKNVTQVINEIRVAESEGIIGFVKDNWIATRLRGTLMLNREVQSINYSIDTVQGVVYLMGVAQNALELNRVVETARTISGVKQVISYVKLAGEPLANAPQSSSVDTKQIELQGTNTNFKTNPQNSMLYDVDVLAKPIPEDAPSIEDQYYNNN